MKTLIALALVATLSACGTPTSALGSTEPAYYTIASEEARLTGMTDDFITELNQMRKEFFERLDPSPISLQAREQVETFLDEVQIRIDADEDVILNASRDYHAGLIGAPEQE